MSEFEFDLDIAICPACGDSVVVLDPRVAEIDGETCLLVSCESCGAEVRVDDSALEDDEDFQQV